MDIIISVPHMEQRYAQWLLIPDNTDSLNSVSADTQASSITTVTHKLYL